MQNGHRDHGHKEDEGGDGAAQTDRGFDVPAAEMTALNAPVDVAVVLELIVAVPTPKDDQQDHGPDEPGQDEVLGVLQGAAHQHDGEQEREDGAGQGRTHVFPAGSVGAESEVSVGVPEEEVEDAADAEDGHESAQQAQKDGERPQKGHRATHFRSNLLNN